MKLYAVMLYYGSAGDEVSIFTNPAAAEETVLDYCREHCEDHGHRIALGDDDEACACQWIDAGNAGAVLDCWGHDAYGEHGSRWELQVVDLPGVQLVPPKNVP
jgi:hypothetical protein